MFSKKGKRKITVADELYYWCVTVDKDTGIEPVWLHVFYRDKHLFSEQFTYAKQWWEDNLHFPGARTLHLEDAPEITPSVVRKYIIKHISREKLLPRQ